MGHRVSCTLDTTPLPRSPPFPQPLLAAHTQMNDRSVTSVQTKRSKRCRIRELAVVARLADNKDARLEAKRNKHLMTNTHRVTG